MPGDVRCYLKPEHTNEIASLGKNPAQPMTIEEDGK
jgi:hypothetical protein